MAREVYCRPWPGDSDDEDRRRQQEFKVTTLAVQTLTHPPIQDSASAATLDKHSNRSIGSWTAEGRTVTALYEWTRAEAREQLLTYVREVRRRVLSARTGRSSWEATDEVRTLRMEGLACDGTGANWPMALVYRWADGVVPVDLGAVIRHMAKPSTADRRALSLAVALQVRSLHVHYQLLHGGLRPESFVFPVPAQHAGGCVADLCTPYLLDWARVPAADEMHRNPDYRPGRMRACWFDQVHALMMVLSEIAEWQLLPAGGEGAELQARQAARRRLVTDDGWKGPLTAQVFRLGFDFIKPEERALYGYSRWDVKCFYDELCSLLAPS